MVEILNKSHFAYLCTTDQNNQPHITPMFFIFDEETKDTFVFTHPKSKKMRNIGVNPKVCLTVDVRDPQNPFENRGVMVQGDAEIEKASDALSGEERLLRIYKEFRQKYPVLSEAQAPTRIEYPALTEALLRIRANRMVYWKGPHFVTVKFEH